MNALRRIIAHFRTPRSGRGTRTRPYVLVRSERQMRWTLSDRAALEMIVKLPVWLKLRSVLEGMVIADILPQHPAALDVAFTQPFVAGQMRMLNLIDQHAGQQPLPDPFAEQEGPGGQQLEDGMPVDGERLVTMQGLE